MKYFNLLVVVLAVSAACHAAFTDYYFYPSGLKPPGIPPDSATVKSVALTSWEDAAVDGNAPAYSFGTDEWGHVEHGYLSRSDANLLYKFTDAYNSLSDAVNTATLHLYLFGAANQNPTLGLNAARITAAWSESSVTWNSKPASGSQSAAYSGTPGLNNSIAIDVTTPVAAEQAASAATRHGIALFDTAGTSPYFEMKEAATAVYRPYLYVAVVPEPICAWVVFGQCIAVCIRRRSAESNTCN